MGTNPYSSPLLWEDTFTTEGTILDIDHAKVTNLDPERREKMTEIQDLPRTNPWDAEEYDESVYQNNGWIATMKAIANGYTTQHKIEVADVNMSCWVTKYENSVSIVLKETYERSNKVDVLVNLEEFGNEQVMYSDIIVEYKAVEDYWIRARLSMVDLKLTFELHDNPNGINYKIINNAANDGEYIFSAKKGSEEIFKETKLHEGAHGFSTLLLAQPEQEVESQDYSSVIAGISAAAVGLVLTACLAKRKAVPTMDGFHRA